MTCAVRRRLLISEALHDTEERVSQQGHPWIHLHMRDEPGCISITVGGEDPEPASGRCGALWGTPVYADDAAACYIVAVLVGEALDQDEAADLEDA